MSDISFAFQIAGTMIDPADIEDEELIADINDIVGSILDRLSENGFPSLCPQSPLFEIKLLF